MSKRDNKLDVHGAMREMLRTIHIDNHFRVHTCYNLKVPHSWEIKDRIIEDYHMVMVLSGNGRYIVNGNEIPQFRGRIIFVSNNIPCSAHQDYSNPPHIIPVRFHTYRNGSGESYESLQRPLFISHVTPAIEKFQEMFESLHRQHLLNRSSFRTGYCSSVIHHILCDLLIEIGLDSSHRPVDDNRILKVQQFMATNPLDRSSIASLAKRADLSEKYFTRLFKREIGITPKRYQLHSRLNLARSLLEQGFSVKETASQLDYTDPYIFSKQFKYIFGMSPSSNNYS